jgi:hypothetical protein
VNPSELKDGVEADVEVKIAYDLNSQDSAIIRISVNDFAPDMGPTIGSAKIRKGRGSVVIPIRIKPRIWSSSVPFRVAAVISCIADEGAKQWISATDTAPLSVLPAEQADKAQLAKVRPKETFIDGVKILKVTPEKLKADVEQDVVVSVQYDLLSRDKGEINLGLSGGMGNGYEIITSKVIEIGQGTVELRAKVIPKKLRNLPIDRISVNLSEYPHSTPWVPLAGDTITVELE